MMRGKQSIVAFKFGTETLVNRNGIDRKRINKHARRLAEVHVTHNIFVTTSGAVGVGEHRLHALGQSPEEHDRRLLAYLGTAGINRCWEKAFAKQGIAAGQILMTHYEMMDAKERPRFRHNVAMAFDAGTVPIANYNDFLSLTTDPYDEIAQIDVYRDNDRMAREQAEILQAEAIFFATHGVEGFLDESGAVVHRLSVERLDSLQPADFGTSLAGTGGIQSKLTEAAEAVRSGIRAFVCSADADFAAILAGEQIATEVVQ